VYDPVTGSGGDAALCEFEPTCFNYASHWVSAQWVDFDQWDWNVCEEHLVPAIDKLTKTIVNDMQPFLTFGMLTN
jgi:hypothetical protein